MNIIEYIKQHRVILAPMAGVTDVPFRLIAREFGCPFAFTEMVDVNGIFYKNRKSFRLLERIEGDTPLGAQLVGQDVNRVVYVAELCQDMGFELIDINAGCPARKVVKGGKGFALLKDPDKLFNIVSKVVNKVKIPVTVKIRSGWDEEGLNYSFMAKGLEEAGAAAVGIHPRTKAQMFKGKADHDAVREIKEKLKIPVFASGDIFTLNNVVDAFDRTGCDAVFIARGALGRPWLFKDINNFYSSSRNVDNMPDFHGIKEIIKRHFDRCMDYYDLKRGKGIMYKHITWYFKGFKGLHEIMKKYRKVRDCNSLCKFIDDIDLDEGKYLKVGSMDKEKVE